MNIMLTSAGRRSYLVDYFRAAWSGKGCVHVGNSNKEATSLLHADRFVVTPDIYSESYIDFLLSYCKKNAIGAIIPLFDIDLPVLAAEKANFASEGIQVVVSSQEVIQTCNDKWRCYQFFKRHNIATPHTFISMAAALQAVDSNLISFPLVVKPRWGMGSVGVFIAEDEAELSAFYRLSKRTIDRTYLKYESAGTPEDSVLVQQFIAGREFNMDVIQDLTGNFVHAFAKEKLAMRSGETDAARTVYNAKLYATGKLIAAPLGHIGNLDVDLIEHNEVFYIIECNARIGGGYPFTHLGGVDLPKAICHWLHNEVAPDSLFDFKAGLTCFKEIVPVISSIH